MNINYVHTEPNSHFYNSLENFLALTQLRLEFPEELERTYVLTGLLNTIANNYDLIQVESLKPKTIPSVHFQSIGDMILFVSDFNFNKDKFIHLIKNTIKHGYIIKSKFVMLRDEVYKNLDIERDYQDIMVSNRNVEDDNTPDIDKPIAEWINYIEYHLNKAKTNLYHLSSSDALSEIRKVTALGVRTIEVHGCPKRIMPESI